MKTLDILALCSSRVEVLAALSAHFFAYCVYPIKGHNICRSLAWIAKISEKNINLFKKKSNHVFTASIARFLPLSHPMGACNQRGKFQDFYCVSSGIDIPSGTFIY
jgi:hypothetical protein